MGMTKEEHSAKSKDWYARNRERELEKRKLKRLENPEHYKQVMAVWRVKNRDKELSRLHNWYIQNQEEQKQKHRERRLANPEKSKRACWLSRLKHKYGLTESQLSEIITFQQNKCAVCGDVFRGSKDMCIDHCHSTNIFRGLLCSNCNKAEGLIRNPDNARKLYEYMLKNSMCYIGKN